jgi:hypothetical protein
MFGWGISPKGYEICQVCLWAFGEGFIKQAFKLKITDHLGTEVVGTLCT